MAKWHPAGILAAAFSVFSSAPALAQQVTPPPVIMQRPPVSPGVVAAMAPQPGAAFSAVCVDVTQAEADPDISFTCKTADGKSIATRNWALTDAKNGYGLPADQLEAIQRANARQTQLIAQVVMAFVTIKALNPSSNVRLAISGTNSQGQYMLGQPRVTKVTLIR